MTDKKKSMSREEAAELYKDLQKAMNKMRQKNGGVPMKSAPESGKKGDYPPGLAASLAAAIMGRPVLPSHMTVGSKGAATPPPPPITDDVSVSFGDASRSMRGIPSGQRTAVALVIAFAIAKVVFSALEAAGVGGAAPAEASYMAKPRAAAFEAPANTPAAQLQILTTLDSRRAELEDRSRKLEDRAQELDKRDKEFVVKLAQLRELTDQLKSERDKNDKKRSAQLEQLANVYGSMAPNEAAALMEQLDVTIALSLIERMPEKRIGQILALMNPERALTITRMLSGRNQAG